VSPSTVNSRRRGDPMSPAIAMPVLIAIRICRRDARVGQDEIACRQTADE
jgi:hypothetical protein